MEQSIAFQAQPDGTFLLPKGCWVDAIIVGDTLLAKAGDDKAKKWVVAQAKRKMREEREWCIKNMLTRKELGYSRAQYSQALRDLDRNLLERAIRDLGLYDPYDLRIERAIRDWFTVH